MSVSMAFHGILDFDSAKAAAAVLARIARRDEEEGCFEQSALGRDDLKRRGPRITIAVAGTFPFSTWDATTYILDLVAEDAVRGAVNATSKDDDGASQTEVIGPDAPARAKASATASAAERAEREETRRALVIANGSIEQIRAEVAAGVDVDWALAVMPNHVDGVALLLDSGASPLGDEETRPLIRAAELGSTEIVRLLLARAADPNTTDKHGSTPLAAAASHGKRAVVEILLAAGADVEREHASLGTPVQCALMNSGVVRKQIVELMLRAGAKVNVRNRHGETAKATAKRYGRADELRDIMERVKKSSRPGARREKRKVTTPASPE
jgi:hypothetical protein